MIELIAAGVAILCALVSIGFAIAAHSQARRAKKAADRARNAVTQIAAARRGETHHPDVTVVDYSRIGIGHTWTDQ